MALSSFIGPLGVRKASLIQPAICTPNQLGAVGEQGTDWVQDGEVSQRQWKVFYLFKRLPLSVTEASLQCCVAHLELTQTLASGF